MTDTITSADHRADLKAWIARLNQRIEAVKHDITCLQDELDGRNRARRLIR
jgi:peptidoglycan hydrolase CwlO-like protein